MAETTWVDGRKVCSRGCGRLVHSEHQQFPGVCLDCAQPGIRKKQQIQQALLDGAIDVAEHDRQQAAVTLDDTPAGEA